MKRTKTFLAAAMLLSSFGCAADGTTTLVTPFKLSLKALNDSIANNAQKWTDASDVIPVTIRKGVNQIAFKYSTIYRENGDDHLYSSKILVVAFDAPNEGVYKLTLPPIKDSFDGVQFDRMPSVSIVNSNGEKVAYRIDTLRHNGFQGGRDIEKELYFYNADSENKAAVSNELLDTHLSDVRALRIFRHLLSESNAPTLKAMNLQLKDRMRELNISNQ